MLEPNLWVGDTYNIPIPSEDLVPENFATPRLGMEFVQRRQVAEVPNLERDSTVNVGSD